MLIKKNKKIKEVQEKLQLKNKKINAQKNELNKYKANLEKIVEKRTHELIVAKEKAEESDKLKSAFLSNISHEIRTPMNAIIGFISVLKDMKINDLEKENYYQLINENSNELLNLLDDIIDISKIESGGIDIIKEDIDINNELDKYYSIFKNIN